MCASCFSHPIGNPLPGLFDQSLIHSQHPVLLGGLQGSLHQLPPHLQLDTQTLEQLKRKLNLFISHRSLSLMKTCPKYSSYSIETSEQVFS